MSAAEDAGRLLWWVVGALATLVLLMGGRLYTNMKQIDDTQTSRMDRIEERLLTIDKEIASSARTRDIFVQDVYRRLSHLEEQHGSRREVK
jgi:hypothetical protein